MAFDLERWRQVGGMFSDKEGLLLYQEVLALPAPAQIIEIGCYQGRSTTAMLQACRDSAEQGRKTVLSVDPFAGQGMQAMDSTISEKNSGREVVYANVNDMGLRDWYVGVDTITSDEWFSKTPVYEQFDMFFIDGLHPIVDQDMLRAWPLLRPGGIMICHDYHVYDQGYFWLRDLIDSAKLPGKHLAENTLLYKVIKS